MWAEENKINAGWKPNQQKLKEIKEKEMEKKKKKRRRFNNKEEEG